MICLENHKNVHYTLILMLIILMINIKSNNVSLEGVGSHKKSRYQKVANDVCIKIYL